MVDQALTARSIFERALEIASDAERALFLDDACADEPQLRKQVDGLLRAHAAAGSFLEAPVVEGLCETSFSPRLAEQPGALVGPYKLLQQIGEGGMGVIFMAEQSEPLQRTVALKIIKPGMDTRQVIARFEAERQALAMMDHPSIAKVLDAGTTDSGRPYFIMELVKGVPITQYCDEKHLPVRARLELFAHVCQAVQHAHQKGIIHRDIKPNNVLVAEYDNEAVPKVIDFGVAKATAQKLTERTMFTEFGQVLGTMEYMSPEQAKLNQLDIDTRSDIYSLGVLLYELLAGSTPFEGKRLQEAAFDEMLRIIREEEPPKPSTRLSTTDQLPNIAANRGLEPKKLGGLVHGELDWIAMRALEKDRNRRYETATGFAADIQRYLNNEPVQACPPSAAYRFRKFARRNNGPVIAGALILLTLVAGVLGTTIGLIRAEEARQTAETRDAESRAILRFLEDKVFAAAGVKGEQGGLGREVTLRKAIEAALPFVETSFPKQPNIEARLRTTLGVAYSNLGEASKAAEQFEKARTLNKQWLGSDHPNTLNSMNYLAGSYADLGRHTDALQLRQKTLAIQKAKFGSQHPSTLWSMQNLASSYRRLGRHGEALKLTEQTLALMKVKLGPDDHNTLRSMIQLATSYEDHGRYIDALKLREETLALIKARFGPDHPDTLICITNLANSYYQAGRLADALALREETLALQKTKLGADHPDALGSKSNLAISYAELGRHADALRLREDTLALRIKKLGPDHPDTLVSMWAVAESLFHLNRNAEVGPMIDECLKRAEGKFVHRDFTAGLIALRLRNFHKTNDAAGCRTSAEMWEELELIDPGRLYNAACYRAITAAVVEHDPKTPGTEASQLAREEADRSMAWLKRAVVAGYSNVPHMQQDADLDALRDREDFTKLVAELEAKAREEERTKNESDNSTEAAKLPN